MASLDIPASTLPYPPIHKDKKFVVLSDWDGTITTYDSNDYMTDNLGFGKELRRQGNLDILSGKTNFRDAFRGMLESVAEKHTFEECQDELKKNIKLDPGFNEFYRWCADHDIPVTIVSSGMAPLIRAVLSNLIGEEDAKNIEIISNDVKLDPGGKYKWHIQYRHPSSEYGHDKSRAILPYSDLPSPPTIFFFGDGVSDMSAAKHADVLFVKVKPDSDNDLATYCTQQGIKHIRFKAFHDALGLVQQIVEGLKTVEEALAVGEV